MTLKNDAKLEEKPLCCFKSHKDLLNFFQKSQGSPEFYPSTQNFIFHDNKE